MRPILLNPDNKPLPEGALPLCFINQEEKEFTIAGKKPIRTYATNEYFLVADRKPGYLEGYLGRTDRKPLFLEEFENRYTYIHDFLKGKEIFFTFDGLQFHKCIDIVQGVPLLFCLQNLKDINMPDERKNVYHSHTTINAGDGNTIVTGNNNHVTASTHLLKDKLAAFEKELSANKVRQDEIAEIVEIVQYEKPDANGQLGSKTRGWIEQMKQKAIDGTWEVGTGTAAGILVEIIKHFF